MNSRLWPIALLLLLIAVVPSDSQSASTPEPMVWPDRTELVVMTFNVRGNFPTDGLKAWPFRVAAVEDVIRKEAPDIIAVQEADTGQIDDLMRTIPGYEVTGNVVGDQWRGYPVIFYRKDRLGTNSPTRLWLSSTPKVPDSTGWGNDSPRCFAAAHFYDRVTKREFEFVSTHFDYMSLNARLRSSYLLADWVGKHDDTPVIVAGDLNETADSHVLDPLRSAYDARYHQETDLKDSYLLAHEPEKGTLHGFSGRAKLRIDMILVSSEWQVVESHVNEGHTDEMYPSDHFPVVATLAFPEKLLQIAKR